MKQKGFTLVELLVVISVIGLLASVILVALNSARAKARAAKLAGDMHQIINQIELTRDDQQQVVGNLINDWCEPCSFQDGLPVKDPSHAGALSNLNQYWQILGFNTSPTDPWGNPYMIDANDNESGYPTCQFYDQVYSAGADGILNGWPSGGGFTTGPGVITSGAGDDYYWTVPEFQC